MRAGLASGDGDRSSRRGSKALAAKPMPGALDGESDGNGTGWKRFACSRTKR
jgi:hypothetical protein